MIFIPLYVVNSCISTSFASSMTQDDILSYIPQRPPFVFVDDIIKITENGGQTSFAITNSNILLSNGVFSEGGLVENMAQTVAACMGYKYKAEGKQQPAGYIAALKSLHVNRLPEVGNTILTEIAMTNSIMNIHIFTGTVMLDEQVIATCELKIFLRE